MAHDGALVHAVTHAIRTHRLDRFSRRELAVAILDAVEPLIRANERAKTEMEEIGDVIHADRRRQRDELRAKVLAMPGNGPTVYPYAQGYRTAVHDMLRLLDDA